MKRFLLIVTVCSMFVLSSCTVTHKKVLLDDVNFKNGFEVFDLSNTNTNSIGTYTYGAATGDPRWQIGQWWSGHNILEGTKEDLGNGVYKIFDQTKSITVDTTDGTVTSAIKVDEYSGGNWPHLLISQDLGCEYVDTDKNLLEKYRLSSMSTLEFKGKFELNKSEVLSGVSQYLIFLNIQNLNRDSQDFGKLFHFGLQIYDSRYPQDYTPYYEAQDFAMVNGNYIYSLSNREFFKQPFKINGGDYYINKDFLPNIKKAFERAQKKGFLTNSTYEDMFLGSITTGWETPGTGECEIQSTGFGIYSTK